MGQAESTPVEIETSVTHPSRRGSRKVSADGKLRSGCVEIESGRGSRKLPPKGGGSSHPVSLRIPQAQHE